MRIWCVFILNQVYKNIFVVNLKDIFLQNAHIIIYINTSPEVGANIQLKLLREQQKRRLLSYLPILREKINMSP